MTEGEERLDLDRITAPAPPSDTPDERTQIELANLKRMSALKRRGLQQDIRERKRFANLIFRLVLWWLVAMFAVLIAHGWCGLKLSDGVLIALITGTTANVLGLFTIVAKYLFHTTDD